MFLISCESIMSVVYEVKIPSYITYYILPNSSVPCKSAFL